MNKTSIFAMILLAVSGISDAARPAEVDFSLPPGFTAELFVDGVENARAMALGDDGTLFVSTHRKGRVYAIRGAFTRNAEVVTIAAGLKMPNGVAFRDGDLYVAEMHRLIRFRGIEARLSAPGEPEIFDAELPLKGKRHAWKYIAFGPDDKLYVSLGAPCNVCEEPDLTVMLRMNADGSEREVYAHGIRNSVGFDWHPNTGEMWFTDNGRDMLGDDLPPCELNRITAIGQHFGFPFCHGTDIRDPDFGDLNSCADSVAPAQDLTPHSAPLGMAFYTGSQFPPAYKNQVFIAEHGSWNRSKEAGRTGYRVAVVRLDDDGAAVGYEPFMTGFLSADGREVQGRPVDVLVAPDGSLLVSDDKRGAIFRISYAAGGDSS